MALITRSEWQDWKAHPVTKAFYGAALERIDEAKDALSYSAGVDLIQDRLLVGLIQAYREMIDFRVEDIVETDDGN